MIIPLLLAQFLLISAYGSEGGLSCGKNSQTLGVGCALDISEKECLSTFYAAEERESDQDCLPAFAKADSGKLMNELFENRELDAALRDPGKSLEMSQLNNPFVKNNASVDCRYQGYQGFIGKDGCLKNAPFSANSCLQILAKKNLFVTTRFLLKADSGVSEGFSIRCHSRRVLEIFDQQLKLPQKKELKELAADLKLENTDLKAFLRHTMALHDIGKPLSVIAGNKISLEEYFSVPLVGLYMEKLGYNKRAQRLAQALVDAHQILGGVLRGFLAPSQAGKVIHAILHRGNDSFSIASFMPLLEKLYLADSCSYPYVCGTLFPSQKQGDLSCLNNSLLDIDKLKDGKYPKIREDILESARKEEI